MSEASSKGDIIPLFSAGGDAISGAARFGAGGGGGDMETRIGRLEATAEHLSRDVTDLRGDMKDVRSRLDRLEVKVDHLPSKGFIVTALGVAVSLLAAVMAFADRIQALISGG